MGAAPSSITSSAAPTATAQPTATAAATYTNTFQIEYGSQGCGMTQCYPPIPGVYEQLNYANILPAAVSEAASQNLAGLIPSSIYLYGTVPFGGTSVISTNGTNTTSFDVSSLYVGCQPALYNGTRPPPVDYPEACSVTFLGYNVTNITPNTPYRAVMFANYAPTIQYGSVGYPGASMTFVNLTGQGFTGLRALTVTATNATGRATNLGIDDFTYTVHYRK